MVETDRVREFCVRRLCEKFYTMQSKKYVWVLRIWWKAGCVKEVRMRELRVRELLVRRLCVSKLCVRKCVCVCFFFQHSFSKKSLVRASTWRRHMLASLHGGLSEKSFHGASHCDSKTPQMNWKKRQWNVSQFRASVNWQVCAASQWIHARQNHAFFLKHHRGWHLFVAALLFVVLSPFFLIYISKRTGWQRIRLLGLMRMDACAGRSLAKCLWLKQSYCIRPIRLNSGMSSGLGKSSSAGMGGCDGATAGNLMRSKWSQSHNQKTVTLRLNHSGSAQMRCGCNPSLVSKKLTGSWEISGHVFSKAWQWPFPSLPRCATADMSW